MDLGRRGLLQAAARGLVPLVFAGGAQADERVSAGTIFIGQSAPLTGSSALLGAQLAQGVQACFAEVNAKGGIHGRQLALKLLDDAYDVARAQANTRGLADEVLALTSYYGTPVVEGIADLLAQRGLPLIGFVSGATSLRQAGSHTLFNVRASYAAEIAKMVEHNLTLGIRRFAVVYQNNSSGESLLATARAVLAKHAIEPVAVQPITSDLHDLVRRVTAAYPQAILAFAAAGPVSQVVHAMRNASDASRFMVLSAISGEALVTALGPEARGIGITQVMPHPMRETIPLARAFRAAMKKSGSASLTYYSFEGYINARVLVAALGRIPKEPTRSALVHALESGPEIDMGGFRVSYDPNRHDGSTWVDLTVIDSLGEILR